MTSFEYKDHTYLAVANQYNGKYNINSALFLNFLLLLIHSSFTVEESSTKYYGIMVEDRPRNFIRLSKLY